MLINNDYTRDNRIELNVSPLSPYREKYATEDIDPGRIVTLQAGVGGEYVKLVNTYGTRYIWIAVANVRCGKTIDDKYSANDRVIIRVLRKGDVVAGWLSPGSISFGIGTNMAVVPGGMWEAGDLVTLARAAAVSMEDVPSVPASPARIKLRII